MGHPPSCSELDQLLLRGFAPLRTSHLEETEPFLRIMQVKLRNVVSCGCLMLREGAEIEILSVNLGNYSVVVQVISLV